MRSTDTQPAVREDHTPRLQPSHEGGRFVHMRPLVKLVGEEGGEAQEQEEGSEQVTEVPGLQGNDYPHEEHKGKGREAVVAVGIDEVVADDPLRVYVVLAKRFDEVGPEDGGVVRPEVVGEKMHEPGEEVGDEVGQDQQDRQEPQITEAEDTPVDLHGYQQREQREA